VPIEFLAEELAIKSGGLVCALPVKKGGGDDEKRKEMCEPHLVSEKGSDAQKKERRIGMCGTHGLDGGGNAWIYQKGSGTSKMLDSCGGKFGYGKRATVLNTQKKLNASPSKGEPAFIWGRSDPLLRSHVLRKRFPLSSRGKRGRSLFSRKKRNLEASSRGAAEEFRL